MAFGRKFKKKFNSKKKRSGFNGGRDYGLPRGGYRMTVN